MFRSKDLGAPSCVVPKRRLGLRRFALRPVADLWPETVGGASPAGGETLQLTPASHGTDGFFVALLERSAAPAARESV